MHVIEKIDLEQCLRYAKEIAENVAKRCYPDVPQWRPLEGDLFGLLMQIDNMTTGMTRSKHD